MSKYIIDTGDYLFTTDGVLVVGFDCDNKPATFYNSLENLEELNSDYINEHFGELQDTAYKKGLHDGEYKCRYFNDYQRGLEDAWEATKRIFGYEIDGGFPINKVREAFGIAENAIFCAADIIRDYTVQEVVDKIKTYEDKHSDRIEVGDEVRTRDGAPSHTFLVTKVTDSHVYGISDDGSWNYWTKDEVTKTGKHYDIASILEAMRE